jgi:hypothetical protein
MLIWIVSDLLIVSGSEDLTIATICTVTGQSLPTSSIIVLLVRHDFIAVVGDVDICRVNVVSIIARHGIAAAASIGGVGVIELQRHIRFNMRDRSLLGLGACDCEASIITQPTVGEHARSGVIRALYLYCWPS